MSGMGNMEMERSERGVDRGVRSETEIMIRGMIDAVEEVIEVEIGVVAGIDMMIEIEIEGEMTITGGVEHAFSCSLHKWR